MKFRRCVLLLIGFLLLAVLGACSGPKVEAIALDKEDMTIAPGDTYSFKVQVTPSDTSVDDIELKWESSDTNVVTISDGKLVGKNDGTAVITVNAKGK